MEDLDVSPEINACSIVVDAEINGKTEKWIVMFKMKHIIILQK